MLIKLIDKIRSIFNCPSQEDRFTVRRLDDCFVYRGKTFTWEQFYAKRSQMHSRFEEMEIYLTPSDWLSEYDAWVNEELWAEDQRARA